MKKYFNLYQGATYIKNMKEKNKIRHLQANWSKFERRCPWASVVSSRELAQVLGISLQGVHNAILRNHLPEPEPRSKHLPSGNRRYWRIDRIKAFLENRTAEEINLEWSAKYVESYTGPVKSLEEADFVVQGAWNLLGVEKPLFKGNFSKKEPDVPPLTQDESGIRLNPSPVSSCPTCHRPFSDS